MRKSSFCLCGLIAFALLPSAFPSAAAAQTQTPPSSFRAITAPRVIAHRGASGYLPEQTLPCFAVAYAQGADYLELDVASTRDGGLICLHDRYLETTTDAAERFPERKRADGHYYAVDFTLAEVRSLQAFGRARLADRASVLGYHVPMLEEVLLLVRRMNTTTGRRVGLLIETKDPAFYRREGKAVEEPLLALLTRYEIKEPDGQIIIQSFDADHLRRLRKDHGTRLPLMWLTSRVPTRMQ